MKHIEQLKDRMKKRGLWAFLFFIGVGVVGGYFLSNLADLAYESFSQHSLILGAAVVSVFVLVLGSSFIISSTIQWKTAFSNFRLILLGISVTALLNALLNLYRFAHTGIPVHSLLWSLFLGSFFVTVERLISVWKEFNQ